MAAFPVILDLFVCLDYHNAAKRISWAPMKGMHRGVVRNQRVVATLDLFDPKNKRKINFGSVLIASFFVALFVVFLSRLGHSSRWLFLVAIALIPATFIHEALHYLFQWLFSHSKPHLGFKFPFPYSALAPDAYVTRNQGILCAIAPFLFITPILLLASLFMSPLPRMLFWALASLEAATCFGDFFTISWLLRYPKHLRWANVNLTNVLFEVADTGRNGNREV